MGFYIELPEPKNKWLDENGIPFSIIEPRQFSDEQIFAACKKNKVVIICLIYNIGFQAAGVIVSPRELSRFAYNDGRPRSWYLLDIQRVNELCPEACEEIGV